MRSTWSDALDSISKPTQAFISFMGSFLFRSAGCRFRRIIRTFLQRRRVFADNSSGEPDFFRDGSVLQSGGEPRREKERKTRNRKHECAWRWLSRPESLVSGWPLPFPLFLLHVHPAAFHQDTFLSRITQSGVFHVAVTSSSRRKTSYLLSHILKTIPNRFPASGQMSSHAEL